MPTARCSSRRPAPTRPETCDPEGGAAFPVVGVGLDWGQGWQGPSLVLWLTGAGDVEQDVYLRPHEAEQVIRELQARLDILKAADRG